MQVYSKNNKFINENNKKFSSSCSGKVLKRKVPDFESEN